VLIPYYRFIHDRVQQAAYSLIEPSQKVATHLQVGTLLLDNSTEKELDEHLFEIVNHLNIAESLMVAPEKRKHLAQLNLKAGRTLIPLPCHICKKVCSCWQKTVGKATIA
jgi:predicted ATPase